MQVDALLLPVLAILFLATFIRSAFGFGEALVAVPLLAMLMPVQVAAPVAVLVSITVAAVVIVRDWRQIQWRSAARLVLASLFGIPVGLWLLTAVPEAWVKALLGGVIIAFSSFCLINRSPLRLARDKLARDKLATDKLAALFGFVAGVMGGAYGMNGPPLVAYGMFRGWSPPEFRATLQGYFLPASVVVMAGYAMAGLWTAEVTRWYVLALPVIAVAILAGRCANRRLERQVFLRCTHVGLILVGVVLLWQAIG